MESEEEILIDICRMNRDFPLFEYSACIADSEVSLEEENLGWIIMEKEDSSSSCVGHLSGKCKRLRANHQLLKCTN